ncbi:MAG TPA: lysozyme inhibitor LprI family protein [Rhizobiaceae bacterium]
MRATPFALLLAAGALWLPAQAAEKCDPADQTQSGLNICAAQEYRAEDAKLNKTYQEIVERLADDGQGRKLLQASQRAWIAFRDAECAFANNPNKDGSIYPLLMGQCLTALTKTRNEQLGAYLSCEEGDLGCRYRRRSDRPLQDAIGAMRVKWPILRPGRASALP